jgi:hypothetical protein
MDRRLQRRYLILVHSHMRHAPKLAAGIASLPGVGSSWTCTQAAWRFLNNDRVKLSDLVEPLREEGRVRANASSEPFAMLVLDWCKLSYRQAGNARHHGQPAQLWVAETEVVLHRPAKKNVKGKKYERAGRPLSLRFIAVQLRDEQGQMILAEWLLLTNLPVELGSTEVLARCYYWRWRIESFFKLLKSHGLELEQWLQETGGAIARRLLVAAMACVVVWKLQADESPKAVELKNVLVRLSGRLTKRSRPHTTPALLAGLWVLLSTMSLLEHYPLHQLKQLAAEFFALDTG